MVNNHIDNKHTRPAADGSTQGVGKTAEASMVETSYENSRGTLTKEDVSCIQQCISVLAEVFTLFGYSASSAANPKPGADFKSGPTMRHWMRMCESVGKPSAWISVAKYKLAAYFAFHLDQPLPQCPFGEPDKPSVLLGGSAYRWQRYVLQSPKKMEFLTSILNAKKGFPRPPPEFAKSAEEATVKALTQPRDVPAYTFIRDLPKRWADYDQPDHKGWLDMVSKEQLRAELRRTVRELYAGEKYTIDDRIHAFVPSTSANYNRSRSKLGAVGELLNRPDLLRGLRAPTSGVEFSEIGTRSEDEIVPERGNDDRPRALSADTSSVDRRFATLYWRLLAAAEAESPLVEPVALLESLKARVISKGPPLTYTALKPLQRKLWSVLSRHRTFQLVGRPVDEHLLQDVIGRTLKDNETYISGDYKDATNLLHSWVSETIVDELAAVLQLSVVEHRLFRTALTQHLFLSKDGRFLPQQTGQLMGSVVSFPVLCIANAALCRFAYEQTVHRKRQLRDVPLLINGDDLVMRAPRECYTVWSRITALAGLIESVGKTYVDRRFLVINSTVFQADFDGALRRDAHAAAAGASLLADLYRERAAKRAGIEHFDESVPPLPPSVFVQTKYVNLGLLYGMKRSGLVGLKDAAPTGENRSIGSRARELYRNSPSWLRDRVMTLFVAHHRDVLKAVRVPWFISEHLGGLGLPSFWDRSDDTPGVYTVWTTDVRDRILRNRWRGPSVADLRLAGDILFNRADKVATPQTSAWRIHQLALMRMPLRPQRVTERQAKNTDIIYARLCAGLLLDARLDSSDLHDPSGVDELRALRSNERLWSRAKPLKAASMRAYGVSRLYANVTQPPPRQPNQGLPIDDIVSVRSRPAPPEPAPADLFVSLPWRVPIIPEPNPALSVLRVYYPYGPPREP